MRASAVRAGDERRQPAAYALPSYCLVSGAVATVAGAGAWLLADGVTARLALWLAVALAVAGAAGLWWIRGPATARRHVLGPVRPSLRPPWCPAAPAGVPPRA